MQTAAEFSTWTGGAMQSMVRGARIRSSSQLGRRRLSSSLPHPAARRRARGLAAAEITAPMPGKVLKVLVHDGDLVEAGQALVVIEAMKMETTLAAESAALVKHVRVEEGQTVDHGAVLIELSPPPASSGRESAPRDA